MLFVGGGGFEGVTSPAPQENFNHRLWLFKCMMLKDLNSKFLDQEDTLRNHMGPHSSMVKAWSNEEPCGLFQRGDEAKKKQNKPKFSFRYLFHANYSNETTSENSRVHSTEGLIFLK